MARVVGAMVLGLVLAIGLVVLVLAPFVPARDGAGNLRSPGYWEEDMPLR